MTVEDSPFGPPDDGVLITFAGGALSSVTGCGGLENVSSIVFAEVTMTCSSATVEVVSGGPVDFTFLADDGTITMTTLVVGDSVEFDPDGSATVEVLSGGPVEFSVDGTQFTLMPGASVMLVTVVIKPGASADACINPDSKGRTSVAILGSATLDVSDLTNLALDDGNVLPARVHSNKNVNGDGFVNFPRFIAWMML